MEILEQISKMRGKNDKPLLISDNKKVYLEDINKINFDFLNIIKPGDILALVGDFDTNSISILFQLIDKKAIIAPLTPDTSSAHKEYFEAVSVKFVIKNNKIEKTNIVERQNSFIEKVRSINSAGLIFFSSGTQGKPKGILHNFDNLIKKYSKQRRTLQTINFLMFDHLGGINTFLHTSFNGGTTITLKNRKIKDVMNQCRVNKVELLPTTPTFLRLLLLSGIIPEKFPESIKIITYGTELMDEVTLKKLCQLLPNVDFRQTYGLSEFNAFRIKSESKDSLYFKFGDDVQYKIIDRILYLKSTQRMDGYLNAEDPFDDNDWFKTNDIVEVKGEYIKIIGRNTNVINVGGIKFMSKDVEIIALKHPSVIHAKAVAKNNPITGQHVELSLEINEDNHDLKKEIKMYLNKNLVPHMKPQKITFEKIQINSRFKKR